MKKLALAILVINAVVAVVASAAPKILESVKVLEISQTGNLMPGPGPARPIRSRIEVEVITTGCTSESDFDVEVIQNTNSQSLKIVRLQPDLCEVVLHPLKIELETQRLRRGDIYPVQILNPIMVTTRFVH